MTTKKFQIGQIYKFNYESTSSNKPSEKEKSVIAMIEDLKTEVINYIEDHKLESITRFQEQCDFADKIKNTKNKKLKDELKQEFRDKYKSSGDKPANIKAQYLFFRNYKPEGIELNDDGYITALFAGWTCTITGKVGYRWFVFSEIKAIKDYITEDVKPYITGDL